MNKFLISYSSCFYHKGTNSFVATEKTATSFSKKEAESIKNKLQIKYDICAEIISAN